MSDVINLHSGAPASNPDGDPAAGQRSRKRDSLFLAARLRIGDGGFVDIRVRNLSEGGLMVDSAPPVAIGTAVTVELRHVGAVPGRIAWCAEGRAGVAFDVPVDPARVRRPIAARPAPSGAGPARR